MEKPLKLHTNLVQGLRRMVDDYRAGIHPEAVMENHFRAHPRWGKRDRQWIKEMFYHYLRFRNRVDFYTEKCEGDDDFRIRALIYSADSRYESILEFTPAQRDCLGKARHELPARPWLAYGITEDFWEYIRHSNRYHEILSNLNAPSLPSVRVNTLKTSPEDMEKYWRRKNFLFRKGDFPGTYIFEKPYRLTSTGAYRRGWFEIQDVASQGVSHFAGPRAGECVVDACAGAGGKTLHLAALMQNKGELIALDIDENKLKELKRRARRAGVQNLKEVSVASKAVVSRWEGRADLVLVDAPCSSSGTYKRKPHRKWHFTGDFVKNILNTQRHVMDTYARLVRPGGHLVYATCSVLPVENQKQIKAFLERNKDFIFVDEQIWYPGPDVGDGFYVAKLLKQ